MNKDIEDLYKHASDYFEKYQDEELRDYLLAVAQRLEDADMMFHQFAYFLMHARLTVIAHPSSRRDRQGVAVEGPSDGFENADASSSGGFDDGPDIGIKVSAPL
jgi:hypothetical protein